MFGRHIALIATIERPSAPFVVVSTHLEVHRSRAFRTAQMDVVVQALADERLPIVLGGDFNSHTFDRGERGSVLDGARILALTPAAALRRRLLHPDQGGAREGLFDSLRRGGFVWELFVDHEPTLQLRLERLHEMHAIPRAARGALERAVSWAERRAPLRLDWFAGRGWSGGSGRTVAGLHGPGGASDHAPIVAEFVA
jgi:endonuclease/exonuclease/phosphatase family metal-dependent hydrolase